MYFCKEKVSTLNRGVAKRSHGERHYANHDLPLTEIISP